MKKLVAIDPGWTCTGFAVFKDGKLVECGYGRPEKVLKRKWGRLRGVKVIVEVAKLFPTNKEKNPQSILRNACCGWRFLGFFEAYGAEVEEYPSQKWKGTVPKPAPGKRYIIEKRLEQTLSPSEWELIKQTMSARAKSLNDNMIDAVGYGRWYLGKVHG